jgi:hypothetical protein
MFAEAAQLLENLPSRYSEQGWTMIENSLLVKHSACVKELGLIKEYP